MQYSSAHTFSQLAYSLLSIAKVDVVDRKLYSFGSATACGFYIINFIYYILYVLKHPVMTQSLGCDLADVVLRPKFRLLPCCRTLYALQSQQLI